MAKQPCKIIYKGKHYTYAQFVGYLHDSLLDELVKSETLDSKFDFAKINTPPPSTPPPQEELKPEAGKEFRSVSYRASKAMQDAVSFLMQKTSQYTIDRWDEIRPKADKLVNEIFDISKNADGTINEDKVIDNVNEFLRDIFDQYTQSNLQDSPVGGTIVSFVLLEVQGRLEELELERAQQITLNRLSQLATFGGQVISALQEKAHARGLAQIEFNRVQKQNEKAQEEETIDGVTSLKDAIAELQEQLKNKDEEIEKLLKSKKVTEAKDKATAKKGNVSVFGRITNPNKEKVKLLKTKMDTIKAKYVSFGFAAKPKGNIIELIKDIKDYLISSIELGIIQVVDKAAVNEALKELKIDATKYGYDNDKVWNEVYTPEFQKLEGEAKAEYVADKLASHIENVINGKATTTPQGKVLDVIAAALISSYKEKSNKPNTSSDNKLKGAIEMLKNKQLSIAAAKEALEKVKDVIDNLAITQTQKDDMLRQAEDIVDAMTKAGLPMAVIRAEIRKGLKDLGETIDSVAKQHYTERNSLSEQLYNNLTDKLVALGLDRPSAEQYAKALEQEFNAQLGKKRADIINKVMNPTPRQTRESLAKKLTDLMMVDSSGQAANEFLRKRNLPILTTQQISDIRALGSDKQAIQALIDSHVASAKMDKALGDTQSKDKVQAFKDRVDKRVADTMAKLNGISEFNAINTILTNAKIDPITREEYNDAMTSGGTTLEDLVRSRIEKKALFSEMGRDAQGNKRNYKKRRGIIERLSNLVGQGALSTQETSDVVSEIFNLPTLNEQDRRMIKQWMNVINNFHGEISKRAEKEMLDYIESRKLKSGSTATKAFFALLRTIKSLNVTLLLFNFKTLLVSIPIGSVLAYIYNGLSMLATAKMRNSAALKLAMQIQSLKHDKWLGSNDALNVMNDGISSLMSDFEGKFTDKQSIQGSLSDYALFNKLSNTDVKLSNLPFVLPALFYKGVYKTVRLAQAFDLLLVHPTGELINIYVEIVKEMERQGVSNSELNKRMKDVQERKAFVARVDELMGYAEKDRIAGEVDATIALLKSIKPNYVTTGLKQRLKQSYYIAERDKDVMEKSYNLAKGLGFMNTPDKGTFTATMLNFINKLQFSEEYIEKQVEKSKAGYALFVLAAMIEATKMIAIPMARIGFVIGASAIKNTPIIGTAYTGIQLRVAQKDVAKDEVELLKRQSEFMANIAMTTAAVALLLSMLADDDDDKEMVKTPFGEVAFKKNPPIKIYGAKPTSFYKGQQLQIKIDDGTPEGKSVMMPEGAIQFGNGEPISLRYLPQTVSLQAMLGTIFSTIKYEQIERDKKTNKYVLQPKSVNVQDLLYAYKTALTANTFMIGMNNMEKISEGASASLFGKKAGYEPEEIQQKKDALLKVLQQPIKNVTSPGLYSDLWRMAKSAGYISGGNIVEEYSLNPMSKFVSDHIFLEALPAMWNTVLGKSQKDVIMKQNAYDIYGMPYAPDVTFDDIANSYLATMEGFSENFEKNVDRRDKMPLNKIFIDKGVTPPTKGVWAVDVTPEMLGKKPTDKVSPKEVAMVDQYVKLNESKYLVKYYDDLLKAEGMELFDAVLDIRSAARKEVLFALLNNASENSIATKAKEKNKTIEEYMRSEIARMVKEQKEWNNKQRGL